MVSESEFFLPIGFVDEKGELLKQGSMRPATTGDELAVQTSDRVVFNARLRDLELLARVITRLGDKEQLTADELENLYEADFLYLQMFYQHLNGQDGAKVKIACPHCGQGHEVGLGHLFEHRPGKEEVEAVPLRMEG